MLRLMNKKDSGLFGGPESETETIVLKMKSQKNCASGNYNNGPMLSD